MRRKGNLLLLAVLMLLLPACDKDSFESGPDEPQTLLEESFDGDISQEETADNPSNAAESTAETLEEDGQSEPDDEKVSGFDSATNQTLTMGGLTFSFPSYYDVLAEESTDQQRHYYPRPKQYYASLMFSVEYTELSQSEFDSMKEDLAQELLDILEDSGNLKDIQSESTTIAGLSAWSVSCVSESLFLSSTSHCSFVFHPESKAVVYIIHSHDSTDQSNFDYSGDYQKVLESAVLSDEQEPDAGPGNQEIDEALKKLIALDREKNAPDIEGFAIVYDGQEIELELLTAFVEPYKKYKTRFNYLLYAVDGENVMATGPAFLFKDVSYYDLKLTGDNVPESFGTGIHCRVTAEVEGYEDGMILLDPVSIEVIEVY